MKPKIIHGILLFIFVCYSTAFADSGIDIAIDRAIAGMDEGSRMLAPEAYDKETIPDVSGQALSPAMDARVIISPAAEKDLVSSGAEAQGGNFPGGVVSGPSETTVGENAGVESTAGSEPNNPIIDVEAGVDVDSGTVDADVGVNPSGDQILDADFAESVAGSGGEAQIDIGSAMDIPVEDEAIDPVVDTGAGTGESSEETSDPIIDIDATADLDSGTVEADVGVDPSGDQLLDADLGGTGADTTGTVEADITSTSDLIEQDSTVVTEPVSTVTPPSGLSAEVDTTGETVGGTTDIGVEADVSGTGAGEDVVDDPTDDGLGGL